MLDLSPNLHFDEAQDKYFQVRSPRMQELSKPDTYALKRFGDWQDYDWLDTTAVGLITGFMGAILGFLAAASYASVIGEDEVTTSSAGIFAAFTVIGFGFFFLWDAYNGNKQYRQAKKWRKQQKFPLYDAYLSRPHVREADAPYDTYMVRVRETGGHRYQLLQVAPHAKFYCVLAEVKAPEDIMAAAEIGVELAQIAKCLEEDSCKEYQQAVAAKEGEEVAARELERLKKEHEKTLSAVMQQAIK
jgi:hypothetical protein